MYKNKEKKIIFFQPNNNYSGSSRVLLTTIQEKYWDWDYLVVSTGMDGFLNQIPKQKFVELKYPVFFGKVLHGPSFFLYCLKMFFLALYYGFSYRQFYVNTIKPFPAVIAGRLMGCSITYHVHERFINPNYYERVAIWFFKHIKAKRLYVSKYLKEAYNDNTTEAEIKYNKLSKAFLDSIEIVPVPKRNRNTVLLICTLPSKEKGVDLYFELAKICPDKRFLLVTSQPIEKAELFLGGGGLPNMFIYQGGDNVNNYYRMSDLIINLSNPFFSIETFGMTILEGMAYGLPAIVPNVGGPKELVEDGFNGYIVDVNNTVEVKTLLEDILSEDKYETFCINSLSMFNKFNKA